MLTLENKNKLLELREKWIVLIGLCQNKLAKNEDWVYLRQETENFIEKIIPVDSMIFREWQIFSKKPHTVWTNASSGIVITSSSKIFNSWLDFIDHFLNSEEVKIIKIYIDTNIISRFWDQRAKSEDIDALNFLIENKNLFKFYTSEESKNEINNTNDPKRMHFLKIIYNLFDHIPSTNYIQIFDGSLGSSPLGTTALGCGGSMQDPLFSDLRNIFDEMDAKHIFQAIKKNLDYFLTLDVETIINRARDKKFFLKDRFISIEFCTPKQLKEDVKLLQI